MTFISTKLNGYTYVYIFWEWIVVSNFMFKWVKLIYLHTSIAIIFTQKVKLATSVEGDPKDFFSIATIPRWRGEHYSISEIAPLYPWSLPYNTKC